MRHVETIVFTGHPHEDMISRAITDRIAKFSPFSVQVLMHSHGEVLYIVLVGERA